MAKESNKLETMFAEGAKRINSLEKKLKKFKVLKELIRNLTKNLYLKLLKLGAKNRDCSSTISSKKKL